MHAPPLPPRPDGLDRTKFHPVYQPFSDPRREIRLLILDPAPTLEAPLIGSLVHAPLAEQSDPSAPSDFDCLSYAWGTIGQAGSIFLSGNAFALYESADAALRRLRRPDEARKLWIDAICINQEDSSEKSIQVPLMRQIYQQARQVCVYLGEAKDVEVLRMALESFAAKGSSLANATWGGAKFWGKAIVKNFKQKNPLVHRYNIFDLHDSYVLYELRQGEVRELLCRPWWTRTWILQEAIVAKDIEFIYGPEAFGWDLVGGMVSASRYDMGLGDTYHTGHAPEESELLSRFEALDELRHAWRGTGEKRIRLLEILYNFRRQGCADARDRIYSFLGLAHMTGVYGIEADYSLPTAEVYLRVARAVIQQLGSLDILNCKREWRSVPSLGAQQVYAYHVYDQTKYLDINAKVQRKSYKEAKRGWALLPYGWECVVQDDGTKYYLDHNTGQSQPTSPLEGLPPPKARFPSEYRICPPGWVREHDNLGRPTISFQPSKSSELLAAAAAERDRLASELSSLPSWVPNWAAATQHDPNPIPYLSTATSQDLLYRASGDLIATLAPSPPYTLSLSGIPFDTIVAVSTPFHPPSSTPFLYRKPSDPRVSWDALALSQSPDPTLPNPYPSRSTALHRLLVGDFIPSQPIPPPPEALEDVELWLTPEKFKEGPTVEALANMSIGEYVKAGWEVSFKSDATPHGKYAKLAGRIHAFTSHRRLFGGEDAFFG
ncbi:heterokaryon incompatibility protein-domain-containing protein [Podospora aff. communis PSN243]|uniref:Heterokaryon incompatibility protein-domain-containing protein n=1 Tax=Podospora aff. communis PSN243 TaxID=3040156 RepID=A0AAV9G5P9_9PEZI|nr:heterokaryon incompatibility protein-domain-containing protein [Podospora aff. communis PSN243]